MLCFAVCKAALRNLVELDRMATDSSSISYRCRFSIFDHVSMGSFALTGTNKGLA